MNKILTSIFLIVALCNIVHGLDRRLQTANIDFINVEANNRKQQPQVVPKPGPKDVPKVTPTITSTAKSVPALPKEPPKPSVPQATTPKVAATTPKVVATTPTSKVKQLAKNYDDRVSQIGKQVADEHKTRFNLTQSEFPALPKSSGTVASAQNPGSRTWSSVVAGDKPNNPHSRASRK